MNMSQEQVNGRDNHSLDQQNRSRFSAVRLKALLWAGASAKVIEPICDVGKCLGCQGCAPAGFVRSSENTCAKGKYEEKRSISAYGKNAIIALNYCKNATVRTIFLPVNTQHFSVILVVTISNNISVKSLTPHKNYSWLLAQVLFEKGGFAPIPKWMKN